MNCVEIKELLYDFSLCRLEPGRMDSVKQHLDSCADCHADYKAMLKVNGLFKGTVENPPESIKKNIDRAIAKERGLIARILRPAAVLSFALSAIIVVFIAGYLLKYNSKKQVAEYLNDTYEIYTNQDEENSAHIITTDYAQDIGINE